MNFKYPLSKEDGTDYTAEELYSVLSREKSGHYLLGNHQFWHGGIHFTSNTVGQCALKQPIRCIADGEVIAYRLNKTYKESTLNTTTLQYSNSFCLVKHEYKSPSEPVKEPEKAPTKLNDTWKGKKIETQASGFASYSNEDYNEGRKQMPTGLMLEILQVKDTTKKIGKTEYYLAHAKVLKDIKADTPKNNSYTKDEELWFAAFKKDGSLQYSNDAKKDLFRDITPQDWTSKTITLSTTYTGYKTVNDTTETIVIPDKTALQIKEVQTEATEGYHYSKVTASIALKMQGADKKWLTTEWPANKEFWIPLTDREGYVPVITGNKDLYTDTTPPPEPKTNKLTFYSLYIHLLPYEEYPIKKEETQRQAKIATAGLRARDKIIDEAGTQVLGTISKDTIVNILEVKEDEAGNYNCARVTIADNSGKITQVNATTKKMEEVTPSSNGFWIVLKEKQISNGKITWKEHATELPQPKREYPNYWAKQVTAKVTANTVNVRQAPAAGSDTAAATLGVQLKKDDEVTYSNNKVKTLKINGKDYRMAECKLTKDKAEFTAKGITTFWACVDSSFMTTVKAEPSNFEIVANTNPVKISAGDPVGYLGLYEVPSSASGGKSDQPKKQVHIEIFTTTDEAELKKFLNNEAGLTGGKQYIHIPKGAVLNKMAPTNSKEAQPNTTEQLGQTYHKTQQDHIIAPEKATLTDRVYQVTLYENKQSITGYISESKTLKISQYELTKLGFKIVKEENASADGSVTTKTDGFIDQADMTPFFQDICKEIDSKENGGDGDDKLSLPELRRALIDPVLSDKWSKLIAYHPTEWQAKGSDTKWSRLDTDILKGEANKALREHEKERITNLVFWDDVPELKGKTEAYHFHPVAFVEYLKIITEVTVEYHIYHDGVIKYQLIGGDGSKTEKDLINTRKVAKYIYYDKNNNRHELGSYKITTVNNFYPNEQNYKDKLGGNKIYLMDMRKITSYYKKIGNMEVQFIMGINTNRYYANDITAASLLGAMLNTGYTDFNYNGCSNEKGESVGGSKSHKNGINLDMRYLRIDESGENVHLDTNSADGDPCGWKGLDVERQNVFIDELTRFGWKSKLSWEYWTNNSPNTIKEWVKWYKEWKKSHPDEEKPVLKNVKHFANHNHHLHLQAYSPTLKKKTS